MSDKHDLSCDACAACPSAPSRRTFLQIATGFVITAAALGLSATEADALPVTFAEGQPSDAERRYPMPASDGVTIDKTAQVIVVRYQGHVYAFNLACPHQNQMLRWLPNEGRFQCPKHESKYQPTGTFINGRATRHMDRLAVRVDAGALVVNLDKMFMSDKDPAAWAAATITI
jgi:nitrite reductase/ring-hydroxylating ferredoxin subunit